MNATDHAPQLHAFRRALEGLAHAARERFARTTPAPPPMPRETEERIPSSSRPSFDFEDDAITTGNRPRVSEPRRT